MKMKKYNAPSIAEAMKLIRADLGEDAVILNSKVVVTKKFLGLVKKRSFEVVAGVDRVEKKSLVPPLPELPSISATVQQEEVIRVAPNEQRKDESFVNEELKKEIADLKSIMQSVQRQSIQSQYPDELLPFIDYLKSQELSIELITAIGDELFKHFKNSDHAISFHEMREFVENYLRQQLLHVEIGGLTYDKKYINVLGPTGVGKTTTIAKMAARSVLEKKKKIGFITTDTYRIAAIEQLKIYAGLLQAPVEIVYSREDYKNAIKKLDYLDLIFIDTAGRNYKEAKYVNDLQTLIDFSDRSESFLVVSLTAKERDVEAIVEQFEQIPINKFIFTKMDETNSIGTMFNLMIKYKKGLAYYTNGQEVPEDIEQPDLEKLFELFFQGEFE
ncbi:flagellar biosynthesis protein FlhF [Lysinibacillus sp. KU-BSD001]|uniref:flagellar biosynthesis protein FlhF n=1 Tax=Lysinibacillus sp. KU-BSD001 TaxID=3141328 RepID=UPI0036EF2AB9